MNDIAFEPEDVYHHEIYDGEFSNLYNNEYKTEEKFEIELFDTKGGAKLGEISKTKITIEDNDGKKNFILLKHW